MLKRDYYGYGGSGGTGLAGEPSRPRSSAPENTGVPRTTAGGINLNIGPGARGSEPGGNAALGAKLGSFQVGMPNRQPNLPGANTVTGPQLRGGALVNPGPEMNSAPSAGRIMMPKIDPVGNPGDF